MRFLLILILIFSFYGLLNAGQYDINANNFYKIDGETHKTVVPVVPDEAGFKALGKELAFITSNKMLGPAKTLGILGFDISYIFAITNINENADYWIRATSPNIPQDFVPSMQLSFSKGLFMSLELTGEISHIFQSSIWGIGLNVKDALVEGYKYAPEVSIFAGIDTLMGTKNYTLLTIPVGIIVSKTIGLGGIIKIIPYAGYRLHIYRGASEVLYTYIGNEPKEFVIPPFWGISHSAIVGLMIKGGIVSFGFEGLFTSALSSYAFKLGLNF